jgi:hypothetical protein
LFIIVFTHFKAPSDPVGQTGPERPLALARQFGGGCPQGLPAPEKQKARRAEPGEPLENSVPGCPSGDPGGECPVCQVSKRHAASARDIGAHAFGAALIVSKSVIASLLR